MKLKEIISNFFNRFLSKEKLQTPNSLPENTMRNSLKYINGEQLLERRKEQYKSVYNVQITSLLLENGVNPLLAQNPKISSIIIDKLGLLKNVLNDLKEQINLNEEYSINDLQISVGISDKDVNQIGDYISNILVENGGDNILMLNEDNNIREEYKIFHHGIMCSREYIETDERDYNIFIKEVVNSQGKYIARHINVIESGITQGLATYTYVKSTTIDSFTDGSYAEEGFHISHKSRGNNIKSETLENYGQSLDIINSNSLYTKEKAKTAVKKLMFNKKYDSQSENIENKSTSLIYKIKQNVTQKFLQEEQKIQENPQKYYITDEAKKYFETEKSFENKAIQLLEKNQIEHEKDN